MSGESGYPPPEETVTIAREGNKVVLSLIGENNLYTNPEFKQKMLEAIADEEVEAVSIDFSQCTFIDGTTLGTLVGGVKRCRPTEKGFALRGMGDRNIRKIFEIQGLDRVFHYEDELFTQNADEIRAWAEAQGAKLVVTEYGTPRLIFPGQKTYSEFDDLSWESLDEQLVTGRLGFVYQPEGQVGAEFPYTEFISIPEPKE